MCAAANFMAKNVIANAQAAAYACVLEDVSGGRPKHTCGCTDSVHMRELVLDLPSLVPHTYLGVCAHTYAFLDFCL